MKIVKKITVFDVVLTVILVLLSLLFIYPLWTIFVAAFSEPLDYIKNPSRRSLRFTTSACSSRPRPSGSAIATR